MPVRTVPTPPYPVTKSSFQRGMALVVALSGMATIWLILLPALATEAHVAQHIATQRNLEIDPSAMFYSELKVSEGIAQRSMMLSRQPVFWTPGKSTQSAAPRDQ